MRRDYVASTSIRRHFGTNCPLGKQNGQLYLDDHIARNHTHMDITTCNNMEQQQKYRLVSVSNRLRRGLKPAEPDPNPRYLVLGPHETHTHTHKLTNLNEICAQFGHSAALTVNSICNNICIVYKFKKKI